MRATATLLGVLLVAVTATVLVRGQPDRPAVPPATGRTITVTGTGTATGKPDSARVSFAVSSRAADVPEARTKTATAVRKVLDAVAALKLADVRTRTTGTSVSQPRDDKDPARDLGFDVWQGFTARISRPDPDQLAAEAERILDAGLANGANANGGVEFFVEDATALRRQAQQRAVEDAVAAAGAYAAGAKLTVSEVASIDGSSGEREDTMSQVQSNFVGGRRAGAELPSFASGNVSITCTVRVVCRY